MYITNSSMSSAGNVNSILPTLNEKSKTNKLPFNLVALHSTTSIRMSNVDIYIGRNNITSTTTSDKHFYIHCANSLNCQSPWNGIILHSKQN